MNEEHRIFDLIEGYHLGVLSEEERAQVELRMQTDSAFSEYVKYNGMANTIVFASGLDLLREQMSVDLNRIELRRKQWQWIIVSGIIASLAGMFFLWYYLKPGEKKNTITPSSKSAKNSEYQPIFPTRNVEKTTDSSYPKNEASRPGILTKKELNEKKPNDDSSKNLYPIEKDTSLIITELTTKKIITTLPEKIKKECNLSFHASTQLACKGEKNGSIQIETEDISGGTPPYTYQINDLKKPTSQGLFSDLGKGAYRVTITDDHACSATKDFYLQEKNCYAKQYFSFNPDYGEKWEMQGNPEKSGTYTIYNRAGIVVKSGNFTERSSIEWDGSNSLGQSTDTGVYVCTVTYSDGKTDLIEITIVR